MRRDVSHLPIGAALAVRAEERRQARRQRFKGLFYGWAPLPHALERGFDVAANVLGTFGMAALVAAVIVVLVFGWFGVLAAYCLTCVGLIALMIGAVFWILSQCNLAVVRFVFLVVIIVAGVFVLHACFL